MVEVEGFSHRQESPIGEVRSGGRHISVSKAGLREKKGGGLAVWRIGAQSKGVEKSLHLNAPLHPNNSSASWVRGEKKKKNTSCAVFSCFAPPQSLSE